MPEIAVTDEQRERLEQIRRDVEEAFVDTYGHARLEDAVEYLLDTYTPPDEERASGDAYHLIATADYPELQRVASNAPEVPGSGIEADEMRGKLLTTLGPEEFAAELEAVDDETADASASAGSDSEDTSATEDDSPTGDAGNGDGGGTPTDGIAGDAGPDDAATSPLTAANRLLDEHDDRWRETDGDVPYVVDLPDGSTESARTRDDVRRLLFQHY
jgi:hypothetical protein